jgi:hypothetical protein
MSVYGLRKNPPPLGGGSVKLRDACDSPAYAQPDKGFSPVGKKFLLYSL